MELGDRICDMHEGFSGPGLEIVSHTKIETSAAHEMLALLCESLQIGTPQNKIAVCVGETMAGNLQGAYSYDGRLFGLFTFKNKE